VNIWQSYKQERGCLMHFARLANTVLKDEESARDNHVRVSQSILTRVIHCFLSLKKIRRCGVSVWSSGLNLLNSKTESYVKAAAAAAAAAVGGG